MSRNVMVAPNAAKNRYFGMAIAPLSSSRPLPLPTLATAVTAATIASPAAPARVDTYEGPRSAPPPAPAAQPPAPLPPRTVWQKIKDFFVDTFGRLWGYVELLGVRTP